MRSLSGSPAETGLGSRGPFHRRELEPADPARDPESGRLAGAESFDAAFEELFTEHFPRLARVMHRLSGEPELAADLVQEAFIKLYQRKSLPDAPASWLITVAMNQFRNTRSSLGRRRELLTPIRAEGVHADPAPSPAASAEADDERRRVRQVLDQMSERERLLLLLQAEGYHYRELAVAIGLNPASVGVLLARAKRAFRTLYEGADASR
ncbi:MAG TPA: sigma-70 family RNA polymerase sigma factor [Candidatus Udaeobacter sp.]|nr:sigma-70 family RNA polymerase sigma factor [Candidatus Udaeobacter sp.]